MDYSISSEGSVGRLIDDTCHEYGWTRKETFGQTIFQLKSLGRNATIRRYETRKINLHIFRMAHAGDRIEVERFLQSIEPSEEYSLTKVQTIPEGLGFVKKEE